MRPSSIALLLFSCFGCSWSTPRAAPENDLGVQADLAFGPTGSRMHSGQNQRDAGFIQLPDLAQREPAWRPASGGPFGTLSSMAAADTTGNVIYVGGEGRIFKTVDGGGFWTVSYTSPARTQDQMRSIAVDPTNSRTVYVGVVGTGVNGVLKTTDGGATWAQVSPRFDCYMVAVANTSPKTVYAAGYPGLWRSDDHGTTWSTVDVGGPTPFVEAVAVDPTNADVIYAGVRFVGLKKSTNRGATWTNIRDTSVPNLIVDPTNPARLYAVGYGWEILSSTDAGASWRSIAGQSGSPGAGLALDAAHPLTIYAATLKTTNGGVDWIIRSPSMFTNAIVAIPGSSVVYLAGYWGVVKSIDGGTHYSDATRGISGPRTLAVDPTDSQTVYAAGCPIAKTTDGGGSWRKLPSCPTERDASLPDYVYGFAFDASSPGTVYTASYTGIHRSTDGGGTWTPRNSGLTFDEAGMRAVVALPGTASTLVATSSGGVFRSTDSATTWTRIILPANCSPPIPGPVLLAATSHSTCYLAFDQTVCRSNDGGLTWVGGVVPSLGTNRIEWLVTDPTNEATVFFEFVTCATRTMCWAVIRRSSDGGMSWSDVGGAAGGAVAMAIDPTNHSTMYLAAGKAVYKTRTGGSDRWPIESQFQDWVGSMVLAPSRPNVLYLSTEDQIFTTNTGGE